MVKIRLTKLGRRKKPFFRIIAIDSRAARDSAYLHLLGTYEPFAGKVSINEELTLNILKQGAQPSETVLSILKKHKIWSKFLDTKKTHLAKKKKSSKHINHNKKQKSLEKKELKAKKKMSINQGFVSRQPVTDNKTTDVKQEAEKIK